MAKNKNCKNLIFLEGITYDRKSDMCRTVRVNSIFILNTQAAKVIEENKNGNIGSDSVVPVLVVWAGIEPATQGFSVLCSTN